MTLTAHPIETEDYRKLRRRLVQEIGARRAFLIGIDGPDGAGKSTLARYLSWQLEVPAIELDLFSIPDQGTIVHDTAMLSRILSKRLKQERVTIVEGVRLLEVLAGQPRQPNYLIYVERHDDAGSQRLQEQLQAYREGSRPKEKADYVLKWSLQDPTLIPTPTSPATTLDIVDVMSELAGTRPVFHSEADFQHALACCIHSSLTDGDARLEYKPDPIKPVYLDLWLPRIGAAVELKYRTRKVAHDHNGESFALRDQAARPIGRYEFLKDIQRLEHVLRRRTDVRSGFAILLTNDPSYWQPASRLDTVDTAFRLDDGRWITGEMAWSAGTSAGTMAGREEPIRLDGSYQLQWQEYAVLSGKRHGQFRYLAVRILG